MFKKTIFMILCVLPLSLFAEVQFTVGGALRFHLIPTIQVHSTVSTFGSTTNESSTGAVGFGLNFEVPVTAVYMLSNDWGVGGTVLIGGGLVGGPVVTSKVNGRNMDIADDYSIGFYSFNVIANFLAKTPVMNEMRVLLEAGISMRPGTQYTVIGSSSGSIDRFYAGPNIFAGIEKLFFDDNVSFVIGGRIGADIAYDEDEIFGWTTKTTYALVNFGIEGRVSWFKEF